MTTKIHNGIEYESVDSSSSLKFGDDVLTKYPLQGFINVKFISNAEVGLSNIGYFYSFYNQAFNLFRFSSAGIKSIESAFKTNNHLDGLSFEKAKNKYNWHYRKMNDPDIYVLKNRSNDNDYAPGIHVCKCGFMNKDVATSSIVNGKYTCRQCRLIWV